MRRPIFDRVVLLGMLCLLFAATVQAATVEGTVTDAERRPVIAAMVSVRDETRGYYETVYTDATGHFRLATAQQGEVVLRTRKLSYADASRPLRLEAGSSTTVELSLTPLTDPADIADNLPPSAHFSKIPFDATGPNSRAAIQMTCTNCHSLGSRFNRVPRLPEEWAPVIARMLTNHVAVPSSELNALTESRSNKFALGFDDSLPNRPEIQVVSPELLKARITDWAIHGDPPFPFGIAISSGDGKLYVADAATAQILVVDPKAEDVQTVKLAQPAQGIAEGPDGKMYLTSPTLGLIGVLDPKSGEADWHLVGALNLGTVRIDKNGIVWWTQFKDEHTNNDADNPALVADDADGLPVGGHVGRFDPKTGEIKLIDLPRNSPQDYVVPSMQPYTFGIAIDPNTGDVWYSKLYANKIGHINAKTLAVEEFTPPQMGPRGLAFDNDGSLWVAFSGSGSIASLDPATMKWQAYPLPTLSPDETDAPYSLAVQPTTQDVWVTANQAGQMYRFIPGAKRFVTYPMPTRDVWMRDLAFTSDGLVCGTSGPLPTINIEGGDPLLICVDPGH